MQFGWSLQKDGTANFVVIQIFSFSVISTQRTSSEVQVTFLIPLKNSVRMCLFAPKHYTQSKILSGIFQLQLQKDGNFENFQNYSYRKTDFSK